MLVHGADLTLVHNYWNLADCTSKHTSTSKIFQSLISMAHIQEQHSELYDLQNRDWMGGSLSMHLC